MILDSPVCFLVLHGFAIHIHWMNLETNIYSWIPYTEEKEEITSCGSPQSYNASKEWANKKVVLFAVPGMF